MRKALWGAADNLNIQEVELPISKAKEDSKKIWEQIDSHLPIFALFQSDRSNRDSDDEAKNPMNAAISAAIAEVQDKINEIQDVVRQKAQEIAENTHRALKSFDSSLASELTPKFTPPTPAKWTGLFSINLETENGIPLNKRGSVVRRLVLVSFFKAEAERRLNSGSKRSIIYAVEEPETAQHPKNQKILIDAFETLSSEDGCQVILTTHSPGLAGDLPSESIRFVTRDETNKPLISGGVDVFEHVADTLGVIPDSRVKVLFYVEGPNDVIALKHLSKALHEEDQTIIDLDMDKRVSFVSTGGSSLLHWVTEHYLKNFNCPEFHLYDNDKPEYGKAVDEVNARGDGSWATQTKKREIENYLHTDAIKEVYGVQINIPDDLDDDGKDVPKLFSEAIYNPERDDAPMKDSAAKKRLTKAFKAMTAVRIRERDPEGEVESWFRNLSEMMTA